MKIVAALIVPALTLGVSGLAACAGLRAHAGRQRGLQRGARGCNRLRRGHAEPLVGHHRRSHPERHLRCVVRPDLPGAPGRHDHPWSAFVEAEDGSYHGERLGRRRSVWHPARGRCAGPARRPSPRYAVHAAARRRAHRAAGARTAATSRFAGHGATARGTWRTTRSTPTRTCSTPRTTRGTWSRTRRPPSRTSSSPPWSIPSRSTHAMPTFRHSRRRITSDRRHAAPRLRRPRSQVTTTVTTTTAVRLRRPEQHLGARESRCRHTTTQRAPGAAPVTAAASRWLRPRRSLATRPSSAPDLTRCRTASGRSRRRGAGRASRGDSRVPALLLLAGTVLCLVGLREGPALS